MVEITSTEFQRKFADHLDAALDEPVLITQRGRRRHVLCSHERYHQMWLALMREKGELVDVSDHPAVEAARTK